MSMATVTHSRLAYVENKYAKRLQMDQSDPFAEILMEEAKRKQAALDVFTTVYGGELEGGESKSAYRDGWAFVLPEMSTPEQGSHRVQFFDKLGFVRHSVVRSALEGLEMMIDEGYTEPDPGALNRLAATTECRMGTAAAAQLQLHNAGQITWKEYIEAVERIKQEFGVSNAA